jgi:hypothetical protein
MPKKVCSFPQVTVIFPKQVSIFLMICETKFGSMPEILLSSTYHNIVLWELLIIMLATLTSYGFNSKPISSKVLVNNLYHNKADLLKQYKAILIVDTILVCLFVWIQTHCKKGPLVS